jgi:hypothetical protein
MLFNTTVQHAVSTAQKRQGFYRKKTSAHYRPLVSMVIHEPHMMTAEAEETNNCSLITLNS